MGGLKRVCRISLRNGRYLSERRSWPREKANGFSKGGLEKSPKC